MMKNIYYLLIIIAVASCSAPKKEEKAIASSTVVSANIPELSYKTNFEGKEIDLYKLKGINGFEVSLTNYGARVVSIIAPDKDGNLDDVVLGTKTVQPLLDRKDPYFGSAIGRYANRIGNIASFKLDGEKYNLHINHADNILHGGFEGFHHKVWEVTNQSDKSITMHYLSPDGEEGFPGNLDVNIIYSVNDQNELKIEYKATTDKPTVVNFTNHTYFNLSGQEGSSIEDHILTINGKEFLPVDKEHIPTGKIASVEGTSFDFLSPKEIGESINVKNDQLEYGKGFDHYWIVKKTDNSALTSHATVTDPASGRKLEVSSVEPGVLFYSGNNLKGAVTGKFGKPYGFRSGFCLETMHYPNSPNEPDFPSTRLDPKEEFYSYTVYKFSTI